MNPYDRPSPSSDESRSRIVDLVFAGETTSPRRRLAIGIAVVMGLYAGAGIVVTRLGQSASAWSAEMAARIHDLISAERAVDVSQPPTPTPPPPLAEVKPPLPTMPRIRSKPAPSPSPSRGAPPAQAGKLAAALAEPIDFTGMAFVVGSGPSYAGGTTTASGTSRRPGTGPGTAAPGVTSVSPENRVSNLSRPVSLDQAAWTCPWPDQAGAQQIDEQTVVIRARVRADGRVDNVDILSDPGFGFAQAARSCALRTHFDPARDALGQPIVAFSPPIRVHFFR